MPMRQLLPYAKPYRKQLILCPLAMMGEVAMETLIPLLTAKLIDNGIYKNDMGYIFKIGGLMLLMAMLSLFFGSIAARLSSVGAIGFAKCLRQAIFNKIQDFSFRNIDRFSTASLVTRLTTDVNNAQNTLMMLVRMAIRSVVMFTMATVLAFSINASLATVFVVAVPLLAAAIVTIMKLAYPRFRIMMEKYDAMNKGVQENLIAIRVVKALVRSRHEKEKFAVVTNDTMEAQRAAERVVIFNGPIMQIIMYGCTIAVLWFGAKLIVNNQMTTGELTGYISYVSQILMSLMMVSFIFLSFVLSKASITRICEVLGEEPDIVQAPDPIKQVDNGDIVFDHVGFSYSKDEKNLVLQDINLHIRSGETVGILGGTGSAKSTLVQLIPRLYDVTKGQVLVGGHDVREYDISALRNSVAMVLQKNVLFSGTIEENLRWGDAGCSEEEMQSACRAAAAHDFIMSFPEGYQTNLGQGGVNVSGGQKQRLCIARALLKKPKIMILDDATSAVDTATDASIRESLRSHMPETTKLIIAQRIASVMDADHILVMHDGRVNDYGTHDELMARSEIYRDVYKTQMKGVDESCN